MSLLTYNTPNTQVTPVNGSRISKQRTAILNNGTKLVVIILQVVKSFSGLSLSLRVITTVKTFEQSILYKSILFSICRFSIHQVTDVV